MDTAREIRSMTMVTFPCPPIPMVSTDIHNETKIANSHDLLSFLINTAARRDIKSENESRIATQVKLYDAYFKALSDGTDLWTAMTTFTRSYMMTYTHAMHYLRFLQFDASPPSVRYQTCSWLASQYILRGIEAKAEQFADLPHDLIYSRCALAVQIVDEEPPPTADEQLLPNTQPVEVCD